MADYPGAHDTEATTRGGLAGGSAGRNGDAPVLITNAPISYEAQLAARKKRYMIMMGIRFPCLITAAFCYQIPWLAVSIIALSVPLPWIAVMIANDGPVRQTKRRRPLSSEINHERAIAPATDSSSEIIEVVDADMTDYDNPGSTTDPG